MLIFFQAAYPKKRHCKKFFRQPLLVIARKGNALTKQSPKKSDRIFSGSLS
ncbi:MAG: hypothetical protein IJV35_09110 [Neisseriaceae bacterium]|nr:hypothetical protein [Neisseriaceae bacterium]